MMLSDCEFILDEVLFLESHRARIMGGGCERQVSPFKDRLRVYSLLKRVRLCENCWIILQDSDLKCPNCLSINHP